jgi:hypothetical protein
MRINVIRTTDGKFQERDFDVVSDETRPAIQLDDYLFVADLKIQHDENTVEYKNSNYSIVAAIVRALQ